MPDSREEELARLEEALGAFDEEGIAGEHFGVRLMRESLRRRQAELLGLEAGGQLDLALYRAPHRGTGGEISLVSNVLASLQESLASVAQVLAGRPTARGLIPAAIKESVELRIAAAHPGSMRLTLVPAHSSAQEPLFENRDEPLVHLSVERLVAVLNKADNEPEQLLEDIADVGPRVTSHLQALSRALVEGQASAALSWQSTFGSESAVVSTRAAERLEAVLKEVEEEVREIVVTGRIVGGSLMRRSFELELDSPDGTVLTGKVADEALPALERFSFGQSCSAMLEVREARLHSGETKEAHLLKGLLE